MLKRWIVCEILMRFATFWRFLIRPIPTHWSPAIKLPPALCFTAFLGADSALHPEPRLSLHLSPPPFRLRSILLNKFTDAWFTMAEPKVTNELPADTFAAQGEVNMLPPRQPKVDRPFLDWVVNHQIGWLALQV